MSVVHVRHITNHLDNDFGSLIDMSDYAKKKAEEAANAFHSRAQAAYALVVMARLDPAGAAASVTDSFDDNGIDAVFYDDEDKTLYLVQSKWHNDGRGTIESADVMKYIQGVRDLLEANLSRFGRAFIRHKPVILAALDNPT